MIVVGKPSAQLADRLEKDENDRIAKQIETLGPEGLKRAAALLEGSKAEHDKPIPKEILTSFPVPDVKTISWIPVQSLQQPGFCRTPLSIVNTSTELSRHIEKDGSPLPFFIEYDSVKVHLSRQMQLRTTYSSLVQLCHGSCFLFHGQCTKQPSPVGRGSEVLFLI